MKAKYLFALAALGSVATSANAAVTISAVDGSDPYAGPIPTYDFETPAPVTGGLVTNVVQNGVRARPLGSTGNFWTVGPTDGTPGFLDLSSFAQLGGISFLWGSVDDYNVLEVLSKTDLDSNGSLDDVLYTFTGANVANPPFNAPSNQTDPAYNPIATLHITGADQFDIGGLRLSTDPLQNAFEIDNVAIAAVPEPGTWLLMLLGFGLVGGAMRASKKRETGPRVRYAF